MKYLSLLPLLLCISLCFAEEEEKTITYKINGKEVTVKESENPALAKFVNKIKEAAEKQKAKEEGTEEKSEAKPEPVKAEPAKPALNATPQTAENLYNQGDFKSAYDHYKELAAKGDADASLMLAVMHSKGQGVDADEAAAQAWFTRSAEQGNSSAKEFLKNSRLTDAEKEKSLGYYNDIAKEFDEPEKAETAQDRYIEVQKSSYSTSQPGTVDRTDQDSLTVKTYKRKPTGTYSGTSAKSYENAPVKSYGHDRFVLKKEY